MGIVPACSLLLLVTLQMSPRVQAGRILVFPLDGSHWVNMNLMIQGLHVRGHEITVVRSTTSWYIKETAPHYQAISITLPEAISLEEPDFYVNFLSKMLEFNKQDLSPIHAMKFYWEVLGSLYKIHQQASMMVVKIFEDQALMQRLRDAQYDVVLLDPALPVGVLVAHALNLPTVLNVRWISSGEAHSLVAPSPPSYVPCTGYKVSDKMTFGQRVKNMFHCVFNKIIDHFIFRSHYERLTDKYFGPELSFQDLLHRADLWLMRVDFVFEFPRPTMPNIVYIGGFQCRAAQPLPPELEKFIQGSEENGFILMSLGTLVKGLPLEITSEIAAAFAQLPQKVVWKYDGKSPKNLGNNTLLVKWLPQNDLLGHPKIKAFVSHGGTNGIYESIYHGVPIIGIPLMFDQFENILRLEVRGAAKMVQVTQLTSQNFLEAVREVLANPSYGNSMRHLSSLHRDKPMHPLDTALYWIEFVIRNKGASHLRNASHTLPWYSYHSLDVLLFLLLVLSAVVAGTVGSMWFLCFRLCKRSKPKQE